MSQVLVRYRVKRERADENRRLVEAVFEELERQRPEGIRYATFRLEDGVSFVHLASVETADGTNPLTALATFRQFAAQIDERCDERPVVTQLQQVGSYRVFAG